MSSPESLPGLPQPDVVEKKPKGKDRFVLVGTHIKGVFLLAEPGVTPVLSKEAIEQFYSSARAYSARYFEIDRLTSDLKTADPIIKETAQAYEGLRGAQSEDKDENFKLIVFPTKHITYNDGLMRESLGAVYFSVVHHDVFVSISVPAGLQTEKGPIEAESLCQVIAQALIDYLGLSEEDLKRIMRTEVRPRVDEKKLKELRGSGQAKLLKETELIDETWAIRPTRLKKSPES